jgi:hypothetical protein
LSLILIFFLSGPQEQLKSFSAHSLSSHRGSNACPILEPHCTCTEIAPAGSRMSNLPGRQDVQRENFGELHINFPYAINPGLTNVKRESVTLPCSIEFASV